MHTSKKGITVSWSAVKRYLKRLGFTFRRARRVTGKAPCSKKQGRVQRALSRLHRLEKQNKCSILYGNESRLCLSPVVPYLWQKKTQKGQPSQTVKLPAKAHSRRLNLLPTLSGPTVLVLDNASRHRCQSVIGILAQVGTKYTLSFA